MSCGCGGSNVMLANNVQNMVSAEYRGTEQERNTAVCDYTQEQAAIWLNKINCIKDNGYYTDIPNITKYQLNMFIGVLISVGNHKGSPCYFKQELEEIESFIMTITNLNLCLN